LQMGFTDGLEGSDFNVGNGPARPLHVCRNSDQGTDLRRN